MNELMVALSERWYILVAVPVFFLLLDKFFNWLENKYEKVVK